MESWISEAHCLNQQISSPLGVSCLVEGKVGKQSRLAGPTKSDVVNNSSLRRRLLLQQTLKEGDSNCQEGFRAGELREGVVKPRVGKPPACHRGSACCESAPTAGLQRGLGARRSARKATEKPQSFPGSGRKTTSGALDKVHTQGPGHTP